MRRTTVNNFSADRRLARVDARWLCPMGRFALLWAVALLLCVPSGPAARQQKPTSKSDVTPSGNAQNGKKIFTSHGCYECHGLQGQGSSSTGAPRIGPPVLPFPAFVRIVRQPPNQMPPYPAKILSDQDLADIFSFLQTIPKPPPAKDIPLLNQ
jgi:mono/diheme cytochrome c family protein